MKIIVIYQTKYGSTKEYASWIASELSADLCHLNDIHLKKINLYDVVVFGSYVRAKKIVDIDFLSKNWNLLETKKIVLFTVSGAPAGSGILISAFEKGLPLEIRSNIKYFQLQGRLGKLDIRDSLSMFFARKSFEIKNILQGKSVSYNPFLPFDKVNKATIDPLVSYVKSIIK